MSFLTGWGLGAEKRAADVAAAELWSGDAYSPSLPSTRRGHLGESAASADAQRRGCGNLDCSAAWAKPWKSRRRPIFEDQWGCGSRCLEALVRTAVRRELRDGSAAIREPHRHRIPLGLVMLAQGWITHPQLRQALEDQKSAGTGKIGHWLQQECGLGTETVTRGLSVQWSCPVLSAEGFAPRAMALVMPRLFIEEFGLLPLRIAGRKVLYLAFEDHLDASAAFSLQQMTGIKVESGLLEQESLAPARDMLLDATFVSAQRETPRNHEQMTSRIVDLIAERQPIAARLVRMHHYYWLRTWLEAGAQSGSGTVPVSTEDVSDTIFTIGAQA